MFKKQTPKIRVGIVLIVFVEIRSLPKLILLLQKLKLAISIYTYIKRSMGTRSQEFASCKYLNLKVTICEPVNFSRLNNLPLKRYGQNHGWNFNTIIKIFGLVMPILH